MIKTKTEIIEKAKAELYRSLQVLQRAVQESDSNSSSGEHSKSEGKYDTRGIESSYLAQGQREQLALLEQQYAKLQKLTPEFEPNNVQLGSLVVLSTEEDELNYLILPCGGGMTIEQGEESYLVITPTSPLGASLLGNEIGASIKIIAQNQAYISEIY